MANEIVKRRAALDVKLLDEAAKFKSPREISEALNGAISPERAAARINELLDSKMDYLSVKRMEQLHMHDLQQMKVLLQEKLETWGEEGDAAGPLIRLFKLIGDRIDKMAKDADDKVALISKQQAEGFVKALEIVYERVIERIHEEYPEVDSNSVREMVNKELPSAFEMVNKMAEGDQYE